MPAPDIMQKIRQNVEDLKKLQQRTLPIKVGRAVQESIRENFRQGSFYRGSPWHTPLRTSLGFSGAKGQYGPLLSGSNHLMMSTDYVPMPGRVLIRNSEVYAPVHNDGDTITVTPKMKRFFWAKSYESKDQRGKESPEAQFWKNMALKKVGSGIRIPERHFLGPSPAVNRLVEQIIKKELENFIKTH
jgi:phage gpG-like protein